METIFIALDLETTGLDFEHDGNHRSRDGAENGVMGESKDFGEAKQERHFIQMLTGIAAEDLSSAPDFASVAGEVRVHRRKSRRRAQCPVHSTFLKNAHGNVGVSIGRERSVFDSPSRFRGLRSTRSRTTSSKRS